MRIQQLPASWLPTERLDIVAHLNSPLDALARAGGFEVSRDDSDFPAFRYVHLMLDETYPFALAEYDDAPGRIYVRAPARVEDPAGCVRLLLAALGLDEAAIVWTDESERQ